ncbi:MAG: cob(I)yrinic acid a,c-diamide adenosyltransferase [Chloroflexota bacterium]|nr:MAG: cob(I)yrinic acid a,c-diamide adenosyltransferase [Chloroflexota bacterium]
MIYIFTGDGKGKTSAALGMAFRAAGYGYRSVVVQFMRGRETGEIKMARKESLLTVSLFGRRGWVDFSDPSRKDCQLARAGLQRAKEVAVLKPFLLVLDEFNLAVARGLLEKKTALDFLREICSQTHVVLTGREAGKEFIEMADLVTEFKAVRHPFDKGRSAVCGLDY